jgi:hypothetical protein
MSLRNQLSIRPGEDKISPQNERSLLSQHWMENVPAAHDIFGIWEEANSVSAFFQTPKRLVNGFSSLQRQASLLALLIAVLSSLLSLLSSHYTYHALGVRQGLSPLTGLRSPMRPKASLPFGRLCPALAEGSISIYRGFIRHSQYR